MEKNVKLKNEQNKLSNLDHEFINGEFFKEISLKNCLKNKNLFWNKEISENTMIVNLESQNVLEKIKINNAIILKVKEFLFNAKINYFKSSMLLQKSAEFTNSTYKDKVYLTILNISSINDLIQNNQFSTNDENYQNNSLIISSKESSKFKKETLKEFAINFLQHKDSDLQFSEDKFKFLQHNIEISNLQNNSTNINEILNNYVNLITEEIIQFILKNRNLNFITKTKNMNNFDIIQYIREFIITKLDSLSLFGGKDDMNKNNNKYNNSKDNISDKEKSFFSFSQRIKIENKSIKDKIIEVIKEINKNLKNIISEIFSNLINYYNESEEINFDFNDFFMKSYLILDLKKHSINTFTFFPNFSFVLKKHDEFKILLNELSCILADKPIDESNVDPLIFDELKSKSFYKYNNIEKLFIKNSDLSKNMFYGLVGIDKSGKLVLEFDLNYSNLDIVGTWINIPYFF